MKKTEALGDPREIFSKKLIDLGIDSQKALCIALDVGMDSVDKEYLMRHELNSGELEKVENLIKDFYLGRLT
jgi:hypothetical protein